MTTYHSHGVKLSSGQKEKLVRALKNNSAITIRQAKNELSSPDELMLTKTQLRRIKKAMQNKTGVDIKISKTQIRNSETWRESMVLIILSCSKTLTYGNKSSNESNSYTCCYRKAKKGKQRRRSDSG